MPRPHPGGTRACFDRFYRTDDSRVRATGGSGLGLALVTAHGGRILLDTAPGQGCTFRTMMPLADRALRPFPSDRSSASNRWRGSW
ncbi:ATP-binding protein [Streptomyces sp. NRRL B-24572]|uniref:ATP-binding protein n=1 Tax=Streptomyces sp. NRRL B-24572 TaxID=1962156 RepID=UPI001C4F4F79